MSAVTLSSPLPFLPHPHARLLSYPEAFFSRPRASFARERGRETETLLCPRRDCRIVYWQRGRENKRQRKREGVGRERMRKGERENEKEEEEEEAKAGAERDVSLSTVRETASRRARSVCYR